MRRLLGLALIVGAVSTISGCHPVTMGMCDCDYYSTCDPPAYHGIHILPGMTGPANQAESLKMPKEVPANGRIKPEAGL